MYSQRRKKIIITIIVMVVIVVLLAIGGVYAYMNTDFLKSNDSLFFKYASQVLDGLKYVEDTNLKEMQNRKEQNPYQVTGSLTYNAEIEGQNNDLGNTSTNQLKLDIKSASNNEKQQNYSKFDLNSNNQNVFTLEYAKSNNILALKSDEIATAYIGIENDNLNVLAQKLGISNTMQIPNTLTMSNINELLELTQDEKNHIIETYVEVLKQNINKDKFTKEKDMSTIKEGIIYDATVYRLTLSYEELKQLEIAMLQELKQDSITLNIIVTKAKLLGLDEKYTTINGLVSEITKQINTINNDVVAGDALSIAIYVNKGEVVLTEIILKNQTKFTIYGTSSEEITKRHLLIEELDASAEISKIEINEIETRNAAQSGYMLTAKINDKQEVNMNLTNALNINKDGYNTTAEITIKNEDTTNYLNYSQSLIFKDEPEGLIELNRSNCAVLNDYTTEQLQLLFEALGKRIEEVLSQKMQILGFNINNEITNEANNENTLKQEAEANANTNTNM